VVPPAPCMSTAARRRMSIATIAEQPSPQPGTVTAEVPC
jgi:hypothetical protein